ncbi:DUF2062 domain-containing protein [Candidatus Dependentiae bacterium]|nr:MAG: DUF2062 domain-containing protein [Candidatus Dependentiae bacterium]
MWKIASRIKQFIYFLTLKERSPRRLSLSCCLGIYIAFSPFVGFHTIMIFFFSWFFKLNPSVTFTSSYLLNNPWTMLPLYVTDYLFGDWFLRFFLGNNFLTLNPSWMSWINQPLIHYTGIKGVSFWSFMVGGNLLGIIVSVILYPILTVFFRIIMQTNNGPCE